MADKDLGFLTTLTNLVQSVEPSTSMTMAAKVSTTSTSADVSFMLVCMALVQLMTPGLGFFYAGLCRPSGVNTMMAMSVVALGLITVLWFLFGFSMAFGPALDPYNIVGNPLSFMCFSGVSEFKPLLMPGSTTDYGVSDLPGWLYAMYQNKFAVITPALASGAIVDRMTLGPWMLFIAIWVVLVYVPWCRQIWGGGYYAQQGVVDFAGGIVVHTTSGWTALTLAWVLGPRAKAEERPHSVPMVVLGTALLWFGWFGFNAGSAYAADGVAVLAGTNSQIAAASAMIVWILLEKYRGSGNLGLVPMCVGAVAGLATVTPAAGFVKPGAAFVIGCLASVVCFHAIHVAKRLGVDDALDVWGVHGIGGGLGSVLLAIFADGSACANADSAPSFCVNPGAVTGGVGQLVIQAEATGLCALYAVIVSYIVIVVMRKFMKLGPEDESNIDAQMGEQAYDMEDPIMPGRVAYSMGTPLLADPAPNPSSLIEATKALLPGNGNATVKGLNLPSIPPTEDNVNVGESLGGLSQSGMVMAEYVWVGGAQSTGGFDIRSKSRTLDKKPAAVCELPIWTFDGASTGQAAGIYSEVMIKPVAMYPDPFRGAPNIVVLCECLDPRLHPIPGNTRNAAASTFARDVSSEPWFGIEQEYMLFDKDGVTPLGCPVGGQPQQQGPYYCSGGYDASCGRKVMENHYRCCLFASLNISGSNAEVMPGQWKYQIGPCIGIEAGDQLWISRYLMMRVCEQLGVNVSFEPKPIPGEWNGSFCHTNYSTLATRKPGGYREIIAMVEKLGPMHYDHMQVYGTCGTISNFSYGVADRSASIRIPRSAEQQGYGYFEDRRPASNMDPYLVTAKLFQTTVLDGEIASLNRSPQPTIYISPSQRGGCAPDGSRKVWSAPEEFTIGTPRPVSITTLDGVALTTFGISDEQFAGLPQGGKVIAEYIWVSGAASTDGFHIHSKARTLDRIPTTICELPICTIDGSSVGQAPGFDSELMIKPVAMYADPFRGGPNIVVLCECLDAKLHPIPTNTRTIAASTFARDVDSDPWFGIEQEFTLSEKDGVNVNYGCNIKDSHYRCCMHAGLSIASTHADVMPGQWKYQIGPCAGISASDQLWISRYLLIRVCEQLGVNVSFEPKPVVGEGNGGGCHTNYSTAATRGPGGYKEIIQMIEKLAPKHLEHMQVYGQGGDQRPSHHRCESDCISNFSYGVADLSASICIPRSAEEQGSGCFEDRRPASNMDPYLVTAKLFETTVL